MTIFESINKIMSEIDAIPKDKKNTSQGYSFRGIDDIYLAIHGLFAKHGVVSVPEVIAERAEEKASKSGGVLIYRVLTIKYTFYALDGTSVSATVIGEGMDSGDKASNKAMAVAHKYALLQVFSIPTSELKDPENDSHEIVVSRKAEILAEVRSKAKTDAQKTLVLEYIKKTFKKTTLPALTESELSLVLDLLNQEA